MKRARGGDKRSSQVTFQRRLFVARRLIHGPAHGAAIIADARQAFGEEIYPSDAAAALRHDVMALRDEFRCEIRYSPRDGYHMDHPGDLALLDLPDAELAALAFLRSAVATLHLPNASEVTSLVERIMTLLPHDRRQLAERPQRIRLDQPATSNTLTKQTVATLRRALGRQMVEFHYQSSFVAAGISVRHHVAPFALVYRDGHSYLDAYCYTSDDLVIERQIPYRLDRIVPGSVRVLSTTLPPTPPRQRKYALHYTLSGAVASQRDIALWFPASELHFDEHGAAHITAQVTDLWQVRQVLLRYREYCQVIEPPELVAMMRETITRMAAQYPDEQRVGGTDE